ncbi:uncharacterized protein [Solanum lycopersicum]|uniref:uncharacterized protein isoform X4 n=1 Tax=Solanum lycopersicum TaxID=4081 RepID=UPI00374A0434
MINMSAEANIMTKTAVSRLGLHYRPSSGQLGTVNASPTYMSRVTHGVSIMLGEWQGNLQNAFFIFNAHHSLPFKASTPKTSPFSNIVPAFKCDVQDLQLLIPKLSKRLSHKERAMVVVTMFMKVLLRM